MRYSLILAAFLVCVVARAEDQDFNLHLQSTIVSQEHGTFVSPYSGQNSLIATPENPTSITWTLFGGARLWKSAEFYLNPELAGGSGLSKTLGVAGFPNGEIYRVDDSSPKWNLARVYLKQSFGFGDENEVVKDDKNQLSQQQNVKRITVIFGKFALNDFFDSNAYSHDPRTQFLNWALMDYGAWDYAADTRGYSWGIYFEFNQPKWAVRFASVLVPVKANQMEMDTDFAKNRGDNLEFEYRYLMGEMPGAARVLVYENHADMGNYRTTLDTPSYNMDITQSRSHSLKYGIGASMEQALTTDIGAFARLSWNDGHTETWAFTEIDRSISLGLNLKGHRWHREKDSAGVAMIVNGLSPDHKAYLAGGGYGFIIGDGKLNYAPEEIAEIFYLWNLKERLDMTADFQYVQNPAYNADRGPVPVAALRLHYEL